MSIVSQAPADGVNLSIEELIHLQSNVNNIALHHRKNIRTSGSGNRLSKIKGHGIDFDEVREYQFGDDIRSIDWKTSAKLQKTYSKTYKEERERPVFILADFNPNMFFGTRVAFKSVIAARLAVFIAHMAIEHQDKVGGVICGNNHHLEFKPKANKAGIQSLIKSLVFIHQKTLGKQTNKTEQSLLNGLIRIRRTIKPGSLLFVLSDFSNFDEPAQALIQQIGKHNDIVFNFIYDTLEKIAPKSGQYLINNGVKHRILSTLGKRNKQQYEQLFLAKQEFLLSFCKQHRQSLLTIGTDEDLQQILLDQLSIFKQ